jgi:hypothetical protein
MHVNACTFTAFQLVWVHTLLEWTQTHTASRETHSVQLFFPESIRPHLSYFNKKIAASVSGCMYVFLFVRKETFVWKCLFTDVLTECSYVFQRTNLGRR